MPLFTGGNPYNTTTGQLTIVAGDDYKAADGRAAQFPNPAGTWPNLTNAQIWFVASSGNFPPQQPTTVPTALSFPNALIAPVAGTVIAPTGASQAVQVELPSAATFVRPSPSVNDLYAFAVFAILSDGDIVTLLTGPLQVLGVTA